MPRHLSSALLSILALSAAATLSNPGAASAQSNLTNLLNLGGGNVEETTPAAEEAASETDMEETTDNVPVVTRQSDDTGMFGGAVAPRTTQTQEQNMAGMSTQEQLEARIDERLQSIIERIASPQRAPISEELTVQDLDRLRREAERASATRALRESEYEEIQAELEMISFLQTTLDEIKSSRNAGQSQETEISEPALDIEELRAQWEAEKAAEEAAESRSENSMSGTLTPEQTLIPRLVSIRGAGGAYEAEIESVRGVMQYAEPGDALADGFMVESIDSKGVVVRATTSGNRYSIIPSPPLDTTSTGSTTGNLPIAQDVGPGGGMF